LLHVVCHCTAIRPTSATLFGVATVRPSAGGAALRFLRGESAAERCSCAAPCSAAMRLCGTRRLMRSATCGLRYGPSLPSTPQRRACALWVVCCMLCAGVVGPY
jgi:hypothetical protein